MSTLFTILIAVAAGGLIGLPFFRKESGGGNILAVAPTGRSAAERRRNLREEKAGFVLALRELDFDYETGKLSANDYKALRQKYESKTIETMRELDLLDDEWKRFLETVDGQLKNRIPQTVRPKPATQKKPSGKMFCSKCGKSVVAQDRFCGWCGHPREAAANG
ncbi:MAG TPA: zinc ribbon domain-containing protein [Bdellovibrionota bacterium]|nr:zinc ribbon domain-containing protein [Bdellovibrionota bacterium]